MEIRLNDSNWLEGGYISAPGRQQLKPHPWMQVPVLAGDLNRNGGRQHYRANVADKEAWNMWQRS